MAAQQPQISVADLDLPQLVEVKRQLDEVSKSKKKKDAPLITKMPDGRTSLIQELTHLTNSFAQLKQAQSKFKACLENVKEIKSENKGPFHAAPQQLMMI